MVFRPRQAHNSIKLDWNRWVSILGIITHKNNPLDCKGERPQIMFVEKGTSKTRFLAISFENELA
jgi:hypothetical protein